MLFATVADEFVEVSPDLMDFDEVPPDWIAFGWVVWAGGAISSNGVSAKKLFTSVLAFGSSSEEVNCKSKKIDNHWKRSFLHHYQQRQQKLNRLVTKTREHTIIWIREEALHRSLGRGSENTLCSLCWLRWHHSLNNWCWFCITAKGQHTTQLSAYITPT